MTLNLDRGFRANASHAALTAGIAFSLTGMIDDASAQQRRAPSAPAAGQNSALDPIDVDARSASGGGEGSYTPVTTASSPKQTSTLLNTPQTVTVIPQAVIREQGARTLTEVLRNTPGITFDAGENGFATSANNFKLRGFDSSGSIFIDNSRDNGSYTRDIFNIERVEVFKGASADNGRGSAGGYVNLVTKTPHLRNFTSGEISFGFDEYNSVPRKRVTTDQNYVIAPNTAFRLNALVEDSGIPGREVVENRVWGLAPSLAFGLGTDFRKTFAYEHVSRRDRPDWGVPGASVPGLITYNPLSQGARRNSFYGLRSDFDNVNSDAALARFEYDLAKNVTLSNQTRWSQVDRSARYAVPVGYDAATQRVNTQVQFYDRTNTTLTNLTNLAAELYTGAFKHNVSLGLEVSREESNAGRFGTIGTTGAGSNPLLWNPLFDPNPDRVGGYPFNATENSAIKVNTVAGYLYDTIELSRQWQVVGGIRAERYSVDLDSRTISGAPAGIGNFNTTETTVSGKAGVVYKPVDEGSLYATFGVSYLPPGSYLSNPDISRTGENAFPGFVAGADPVRFHNYEVGVKWNFFNNRLTTAAALFRTEKRNAPITGLDVGQTGSATLKGYGQQIVQGLELSVAGKVTDAWQVFGGVAFMDSERRHSAYLDDVRRRANPADFTPYTSTNGDQLAFTPKVSGNLWTTYRLPFGLTVGGGVQYVGSSYLGRPDDGNRIIPNGKFGMLPAYTVVNLMASYEVRPGIDVRFNVDNVADTRYAVSANWPATMATLGTSRAYRLSTSFKF